MRLIAHRGFASLYPENTVRAVEEAAARADAVEIDVRRCRSGELVVIHDETVDRVTDGTGAVADHTLSELSALNVLGTGSGVPTLSAVLYALPEHIGINVELKEPDTAADAITLATETHPQVIVSSFDNRILSACRETAPGVPRAYLVAEEPRNVLQPARELGCSYLHPAKEICDERLINEAHRAGLSVNAWTIDSRSEAADLAEIGVDGVIADRWGVLPSE
ncbi:MAG: glycerophosphodiester phosphodiesterase family protein [Natronomonas sp.]